MIAAPTYKLLVASKLRGVGRRALRDLSVDKIFFRSSLDELREAVSGVANPNPDATVMAAAFRAADADVEAAERMGHFIVGPHDAAYPALLRQLDDRPAILFIRGDPRRVSEKAVAIIGTREPSKAGELTAERIARYFAGGGWQVVSGLALGVDTVAHQLTLLSGGSTVAVVAHGLDKVYPRENADLADRIVESGGALVSEYGYKSPVFPSHFVERDRIQAGLSLGVVMVQSDETGGSWHASRAALRYGRYLIIPHPAEPDIRVAYPKARGNWMIVHSTDAERAAFLKCPLSDLQRLIILNSRDDYPVLASTLLASAA